MKRNIVDKDIDDRDSTKERDYRKDKEKIILFSLIKKAIFYRASNKKNFISDTLEEKVFIIAANKESWMEYQSSANSLQDSGWPAYDRIKLYDNSIYLSQKTGSLSSVSLYTRESVSVLIL